MGARAMRTFLNTKTDLQKYLSNFRFFLGHVSLLCICRNRIKRTSKGEKRASNRTKRTSKGDWIVMTDRTSAARERYTDSKKKRETQRRKPVGRVEGRGLEVQRRGRQLPPRGRPVKIFEDVRRGMRSVHIRAHGE